RDGYAAAPRLMRRRGEMDTPPRDLAELCRFARGSIGGRVFQSANRLHDVAELVRQFMEAIIFLGDVLRGVTAEIATEFWPGQLGEPVRVPFAPRVKPLVDGGFKRGDQFIQLRIVPGEAARKERLALACPQIIDEAFADQSRMHGEDTRAGVGFEFPAPHVPHPLPGERAGPYLVELA